MALTSSGLTDIGMGPGKTTNFLVQYEDTLPNQTTVRANANALLAIVESEFTVTTGWFGTPANSFGTSRRQVVNLNLGGGGNNTGYGGPINMDALGSGSSLLESVKMVFMNEWVEVLMDLTGGRWNRGDSSGEALSQYCGIVRFRVGHYSYYGSWVNAWLNQHPRQDWVTTTQNADGNAISFGCALAFLYYLNTQLAFSINQIIAAGAANLATAYRTLTGDAGNPYPFFEGLLEHVYPSSATASIPGPVSDDPYPLALTAFWVDKNTFGRDEVLDVLVTSGGVWPKAFWLVIEGFSRDSFTALGITIPPLTGPFAGLSGVTIAQNADIDFENAASPQSPQRIRVPFDITFANTNSFPAAGRSTYQLDASLTASGATVPGSSASTEFELVAGADPYFTNIDPAQNNVFYLSQDLRVLTATPGLTAVPVAGGPAFTTDSVSGAFTYIQALLTWLNATFNDPNGADPFASVLPGQTGALQGDSSVTPLTIDFSNIFNIRVFANYNFAVARVRLRGSSGAVGAAADVRVLFRLWSTETADTDYQPASTYPFTPDAAGLPGAPLVGADHHTLPFFATGNLAGNTDYGPGGPNIRPVEIPAGRDSVWAYYGCFLNLYDASNIIDGRPVQGWLNGTHHCIVAEIAYDGAPAFVGVSPENSDKLAQRNLQVTRSDNPGGPDTHRIPQTFDLRPSTLAAAARVAVAYPDELMIDWGGVPPGSVASIYWPQVLATDVVSLASALYGSHTLAAADAHTIQCAVTGGITYVPIPNGSGENFAGLFTVDLPLGISAGQEFNVVVRRIATVDTPQIAAPRIRTFTLPATAGRPLPPLAQPAVPAGKQRTWRYVVGTFQVKIPVTTPDIMLMPEENTLAIMKWRLAQLPPNDRWRPVLQRYVTYLAARVNGLGGDAASIDPSPNGVPPDKVTGNGCRRGCGCGFLFALFRQLVR